MSNVPAQQAFTEFLAAFGLPVYGNESVPDGASFPYMTYAWTGTDFWGGTASLEVDVWYRGPSESEPNRMVATMSKTLGGGKMIACDGGAMWLRKGSPFVQSLGDSTDRDIHRRYILIDVDFYTTY